MNKPNILLVMADQMTPFMLEACGYKAARTRHMSALAARGVSFTNAYTPSPICVPARSCFMTGLYTSTTGCYDNGDPYHSFIPTFAHYLTNAVTKRCWRARCTSSAPTSCTGSSGG